MLQSEPSDLAKTKKMGSMIKTKASEPQPGMMPITEIKNNSQVSLPKNGADAILLLRGWQGKGFFIPSFSDQTTSGAPQDLYFKLLKLWPQNPDMSMLRALQVNSVWNEIFACLDALAKSGNESTGYDLLPIFESSKALHGYNFDIRLADLAFEHLREEHTAFVQASFNDTRNMQPSSEEIMAAEKNLAILDDKIDKIKLDLKLLEDEGIQKKEELDEIIQHQEAYYQQESETESWEAELDVLNAFNNLSARMTFDSLRVRATLWKQRIKFKRVFFKEFFPLAT